MAGAPAAFPVVWDSTLALASLADVPRRLAGATRDSAETVRWDVRCAPRGPAGGGDAPCAPVPAFDTHTCADLLARLAAGYGATATVDVQPIQTAAVTCAAVRALGAARPARQSAVRAFALTPAALDSLPPVLALNVSPELADSAERAAARGATWRAFDRSARAAAETEPGRRGPLRVNADGEASWLRVVARGDFDGDGWDDVLVGAVNGAAGGTLVVEQLYALTRTAPGTPLRVARRLWPAV